MGEKKFDFHITYQKYNPTIPGYIPNPHFLPEEKDEGIYETRVNQKVKIK